MPLWIRLKYPGTLPIDKHMRDRSFPFRPTSRGMNRLMQAVSASPQYPSRATPFITENSRRMGKRRGALTTDARPVGTVAHYFDGWLRGRN